MWRADVVVVGGGPIGVCSAHALAAEGADVLLLERETEVCPAVSGAHANCGLIVPSDVVPLASPGALGQGLRWLLDASSPFYIAPRLSPALARWLWLFRAASTASRVEAAMPVLRALHVASSDMHDALGREHGPELALLPQRPRAGVRDRGRFGGGRRRRRGRRVRRGAVPAS